MDVVLSRNDVVARARELKAIPAWVPAAEIVAHWLQIAAAMAVFYFVPTWWVLIPVVLVIAARQYGLAILLHDGQHTLLANSKPLNNLIGTWLVAAPLGTEFRRSQQEHLEHHFHFGSPEKDPDYAYYCFGPPSPKQSIVQVAALFMAKLIGAKVLSMLHKTHAVRLVDETGSGQTGVAGKVISLARRLWPAICVHSLLLLALTWLFGWYGYPLLWALPLATLACLFNDFRIFCEHSLVGRDAVHTEERLTSFVSNPLERFFFAPNHMNYHAEHHLFPYVPHRNLPELRKAVRACPTLNASIEWRPSYLAHLRAYLEGARGHQKQVEAVSNNRPAAQAP